MRIVAWSNLLAFAKRHPHTLPALLHWRDVIRQAHWMSMSEIAESSSKAKSVGGDRVRFEIAGGNYRLVASFDFHRQAACVKFIGTHAEYDRIDATTVSQF